MVSQAVIDHVTQRGVANIISRDEFVEMMRSGKPLRLKMGFDPSRPDIHLGHVVGLRKLRELQELGHQVILIVGDWTAQIGDPSGRSATRPMLTHEEVVSNAESYMRQFFRVVDREPYAGRVAEPVVRRVQPGRRHPSDQSLHRRPIPGTGRLCQAVQDHQPIAITELLYPLLQAYDSVAIESDVEFGGTDQMFNLLVGRDLQEMMGQKPQQCFLMPILPGTDGVQKMSKSLDNYVAVEEPPNDMYGKLMSLPDSLIVSYFEYLTDTPDAELTEMAEAMQAETANPMDFKKRLAGELTAVFHDPAAARDAQAHFERVVQQRSLPDEIPEFAWNAGGGEGGITLSRLLVSAGMASSNAEAKRLINQGAVQLFRESAQGGPLRSEGATAELKPGDVLRVGRRRFVRLVQVG